LKINIVVSILLFLSCSSIPKKNYEKKQSYHIYANYLSLGDAHRKQKQYKKAQNYYSKAIFYANSRGDRKNVLKIQLKQILINIALGDTQSAQSALTEVQSFNKLESLKLENDILAVQTKLALATNDHDTAQRLLDTLIGHYKENTEKHAYYTFLKAKHFRSNISYLTEIYNEMYEQYIDGELENIEVISFIFPIYSKILLDEKKYTECQLALDHAYQFYKSTEHKRGIIRTYQLYAALFRSQGLTEKATHYTLLSEQL